MDDIGRWPRVAGEGAPVERRRDGGRKGGELTEAKTATMEGPTCIKLVRKVQFILVLLKGNLTMGVYTDRQTLECQGCILSAIHFTCKMILFLECRLEWVESRGSAPPYVRHNPRSLPPSTSTLQWERQREGERERGGGGGEGVGGHSQ